MPYGKMLASADDAQAIVVLASNIEPVRPGFPLLLPDINTYARCRYAAWLYFRWRQVPVVVSGGTRRKDRPPFSAAMARIVEAEGVPPAAIVQENQSVNTRENAVFTAEILRRMGIRTIALVVDADSMLRADLCFRKQDIIVVPAPIRHRSLSLAPEHLIPSWSAIRGNELTLHEMLGLAWYKLRGWI
jgi:uncharacterized SAM-binding protein YcdF (DUF218 family)